MRIEETSVIAWLIIVGLGIIIWGLGFVTGRLVESGMCDVGEVYVVSSGECVAEDDHERHMGKD